MVSAIDSKRVALVVIDTTRHRYSRYVGKTLHRVVEGRELAEDEIEHFRINPADFIEVHCGPEAA